MPLLYGKIQEKEPPKIEREGRNSCHVGGKKNFILSRLRASTRIQNKIDISWDIITFILS